LEVTAEAALTGYGLWASRRGIGEGSGDFDSDGVNNLYEYAMGGDPTNPTVRGMLPVFSKSGNRLLYIHPKRADDADLTYTVETRTNLVSGAWTTHGYVVKGTNTTGGTLDFVTNEVDAVDSAKFMRLRIHQ
jgi:hypothetical protein